MILWKICKHCDNKENKIICVRCKWGLFSTYPTNYKGIIIRIRYLNDLREITYKGD